MKKDDGFILSALPIIISVVLVVGVGYYSYTHNQHLGTTTDINPTRPNNDNSSGLLELNSGVAEVSKISTSTPVGDRVLEDGVYSIKGGAVYYNDFFKGGVLMSIADPMTFQVIKSYGHNCSIRPYARDKNYVYIEERVIFHADPQTFSVVGDPYYKDKNHVYYSGAVLEGADPQTFQLIDVATSTTCAGTEWNYARDKNSVFKGPKVISKSPDYFEVLNRSFYKDDKQVYNANLSGTVIDGADPESFVAISDYLAKDKKHVYQQRYGFDGFGELVVLTGYDPSTFRSIENTAFYRDKNNLYYLRDYGRPEDSIIKGSDPDTFTKINDHYFKDKNKVYGIFTHTSCKDGGGGSVASVLLGADPKTFVPINNQYSKDASHVFYASEMIIGADPETFLVVDVENATGSKETNLAKDKNNVYLSEKKVDGLSADGFSLKIGFVVDKTSVAAIQTNSCSGLSSLEIVKGADPITFVGLGYGYGKDANKVYFTDYYRKVKSILDADPKTFVVLGRSVLGGVFAKDKNYIYLDGFSAKFYSDGDLNSLKFVGSIYALDSRHVYYTGGFRNSSVPEDAVAIGRGEMNSDWVVIDLADPKTFDSLKATDSRGQTYDTVYGKDKTHVFYYNAPLTNAQPDSFMPLENGYAKDYSSVYYNGKKILSADATTFKIDSKNVLKASDKYHSYNKGIISDVQ